ncbi:MAG: hypothetical protein ACYTKD_01835 [Planctomycetota bacterium]|jgi:hypothetical protein
MPTNAAPTGRFRARTLLVAFDAALLVLGILLCVRGAEEGALLAIIGSLFLALATWNAWPLPARRAAQAIVALAWLSFAVWFCLSWGSRVEVPEGAISSATWRGWPLRFGLRSHSALGGHGGGWTISARPPSRAT